MRRHEPLPVVLHEREEIGALLIHLKVDACFDPLRDDRRFGAIMKKLGLDP